MTKYIELSEERVPVLAAVGQYTRREPEGNLNAPLDMLLRAVEQLTGDAGVDMDVFAELDVIAVVKSFKNTYRNPAELLGRRLGAERAVTVQSATGGNTPQSLVNHYMREIAEGKNVSVLLAGAEMLATNAQMKKQGVRPDWPDSSLSEPLWFGDKREGTNDLENAYGLAYPRNTYPLFENALRAHYGSDVATHQREIAKLFSGFSRVAKQNAYAWLPQFRSSEELLSSQGNRMVCFPYTKLFNAMPLVDQSAALLLTTAANARRLGIPEENWVYLQGGAEAAEHWFVSERASLHDSPAIKAMGGEALRQSGIDIGQVRYFDLYSCFPSAVQIARDALGVAKDDPRPLTVTGGLPYFGGPGNNYSMHGIAGMAETLRKDPGAFGMVTANGWYLTRHSIGIYSTRPAPPPDCPDLGEVGESVPCLTEVKGAAAIETYAIPYSRDGVPERAIIVGRLAESRQRFLALSRECGEALRFAEKQELVGLKGLVSPDKGINYFSFS